jgi:SAM-dependent methyltransferase
MPERQSETERIRHIYDRRAARPASEAGNADVRWLGAQAYGDTLEVGIGRGRTLPFYPPTIRLTGIELSPVAVGAALRRARDLGIKADLRVGDASSLPFPGEHFDTVIFSYSLCTIPDDRAAIAEAVRVLRPGGRLALVEHVRSHRRVIRGIERLAEPLTMRWMADHLLRDPLNHVLAEGLDVTYLERRMLGLVERLLATKPECNDMAEVS